MATLTYDLAVIGRRTVESELASLERRFTQHAATLNKISSKARTEAAKAAKPAKDGPMAGPGHKEYLVSIAKRHQAELASQRTLQRTKLASERAAERANLASQRTIQRTKLADERAAERAKLAGDRRSWREYSKEKAKAEGVGSAKGRKTAALMKEARDEARELNKALIGKSYSRISGTVGAIGKAGLTAAGVSGAALAASSISNVLNLDETTRRLVIAGRGPGEKGADPVQMRRDFTNLGIETGINPEQIAQGAGKFVAKTGDLNTAMANMRNFAVTAQATGASVEDIASAGADLSEKFDIKAPEDMAKALSILAYQGKKGAFELKDMAEQFPEMAAAAQRAGMSGVSGMRTLGGLAQIARESTGSGSEASTALQMMLTQLVTKSGKLKSGEALGGEKVDVFEGGDPTKKARDIPTILSEIISKSHGNQQQIAKLFDIRGTRAVSPLVKVYRDASEKQKGSAEDKEIAGKQAVLGYIERKSDSGAGWADVQADAADAMKSTSVQLDILRTKLEAAVSSSLFPAFMRLVPEIERLVPFVGQAANLFVALVTTLASNPIAGIGSIITAQVMKDIAGAGLGTAAKMAIDGALSKWAVGAGILGLLIGAFEVGQMVVKTMQVQAQQKVDQATQTSGDIQAQALKELQEKGTLSPETRLKMDQLNLTQTSTIAGAAAVGQEGFGDTLGRAWNSLTGQETGTLAEKMTLQTAGGDAGYRDAAFQTKQILDLDDMSKRMTNGAEEVKQIMIAGATEAKDVLVNGAKAAPPNRGDAPTGDIKNKK